MRRHHLGSLASQPFTDLFDDRILVGKLPGLQLRVDEFAIGSKLEAPATGRLKLEALDTLFVAGQQFLRQTDGLGFIVSLGTVAEMHVHCRMSFQSPRTILDGHTIAVRECRSLHYFLRDLADEVFLAGLLLPAVRAFCGFLPNATSQP